MLRSIVLFLSVVVAVALMVAAIWAWIDLADWALAGTRPQVLRWAARAIGVSAAAGAQVLVITFVLGRLYSLRRIHDIVRLAAAVICCSAAISAAAMGLAAQG